MNKIDFSEAIKAYKVCAIINKSQTASALSVIYANNHLKHELNKCFKDTDLPLHFILFQFEIFLSF